MLDLLEFNLKIPYPAIFALLGLFVVLLWGSLVYYVWLDSKTYFPTKSSQNFFTVMTLAFGFGGLLVYLLYRGSSMEQRQLAQIEDELSLRDAWLCPRCSKTVLNSEQYCVNCGLATKKKCEGCGNFNRPANKHCQSCGRKLPSQKPELVVPSEESTSKLQIFQDRLEPFQKKLRSELKNPRNFKFEITTHPFIKKKSSNNYKSEDSEDI